MTRTLLSLAVVSLPDFSSAGQTASVDPFWGCGLLGKDIQPTDPVWSALIADLKQTNRYQKVATWNWDIQPQSDEHLSPDFLFFPNIQCAGTSTGAGGSYLNQNAGLPGGAIMAPLALGGNEPDQVGYCQNYTHPGTHISNCDGFKMREGQCTGDSECYCQWDPKASTCRYDVTGCGMWPVSTAFADCTGQPFPFWCFGSGKKLCNPGDDPSQCCSTSCHGGVVSAFSEFYVDMANKGYTYATTPIVAGDLSFYQQLMEEAGCGQDAVKQLKGQERLKRGCPTHTAFHFYSTGCPTDPNTAIQGFTDHVKKAKDLNTQFAMDGTIVNELGSLKGQDTQCADEEIAGFMGKLFEFLESDDGKGVVSQMIWFNEDQTGGTFDLRLVKDGKLSKLGETYKNACKSWAQAHMAGDEPGLPISNLTPAQFIF